MESPWKKLKAEALQELETDYDRYVARWEERGPRAGPHPSDWYERRLREIDEEFQGKQKKKSSTEQPVIAELSVASKPDGTVSATLLLSHDNVWTYPSDELEIRCGLYMPTCARYAQALTELEGLINSGASEKNFQSFFEEYPEFLMGDEYKRVIPQASIVPISRASKKPWRPDFVLTPFDQDEFAKILELKPPDFAILKNEPHGHIAFHNRFYSAVQQLGDYGQAFEEASAREHFMHKYGEEILTPRLELVVGRRWAPDHNKQMFKFQQERRIEIHNWDSYLAKLKRRYLD